MITKQNRPKKKEKIVNMKKTIEVFIGVNGMMKSISFCSRKVRW